MRRSTPNKVIFVVSPFFVSFLLLVLVLMGSQANRATAVAPQAERTTAVNATNILTPTLYLPIILDQEPPEQCYYVEQDDGYIIIEVESGAYESPWAEQTSFPDYTGTGYLVWTGPNMYEQPGEGIISYPISLTQTADYVIRIRSAIGGNDTSLNNDVFIRLDDGPWIKLFTNILNQWTYEVSFDLHPPASPIISNVPAGMHTLELSGRSNGFLIDRLTISREWSGAQNPELAESDCIVP